MSASGAGNPAQANQAKTIDEASLRALADLCAHDEYFTEQAAGFNDTLLLARDGQLGWLHVTDDTIDAGAGEPAAWLVGIVGTAAQWDVIWQGLPGGLHRAWRQELLEFRGSELALLRHYPMFWRLGELMVTTGWSA